MPRSSERTLAESLVIQISVFLAGASLMAMEILAFRIIGKNFGTALRETSIVISVFLLAMSIGYWGGGRIADSRPVVRTFALVLLLAGISILPVPLLDPIISDGVYESGLPLPLHSFVVSVVLFSIPTVLLASVSPIATRLLAPSREKAGSTAGVVSALSTAGSVTGSLIAAFALIEWFHGVANAMSAIAIVSVACALASEALSSGATEGPVSRRRVAGALGIVAAASVGIGALAWRPAAPRIPHDPNAREQIIHRRDTPYHSIVVIETDRRFRTLAFGRYFQSGMSIQDPFGPGFPYTDFFHLPMILNPDASQVLFIGVGGGTGPKQFFRHYPKVQIAAVEVDPGVIDVARQYFALPDDPRVKVDVADGRTWLRRSATKFDAVMVDAFTVNRYGISLPWHFATREFFQDLERKTTAEGIIVFNTPGHPECPIAQALIRTMALSFPSQLIFRSNNNTVIVASRRHIGMSGAALAQRIAKLRAEGRIHLPGLEGRALQMVERPTLSPSAAILTDDNAPVDDLLARSLPDACR